MLSWSKFSKAMKTKINQWLTRSSHRRLIKKLKKIDNTIRTSSTCLRCERLRVVVTVAVRWSVAVRVLVLCFLLRTLTLEGTAREA